MALPLQERAMEAGAEELVRLSLLDTHASPALAVPLIPSRPIEPGEQYRFHFDMTKCIGCRSCEVACNEQNGNPAAIKWRRVGELEGGTYPDTLRTYLSMGCNHCLSADCLRGCPVNAYTKDPLTGIVLHSADACIGCQYCVWNCPYSVPQFNPERGVVGKCDMCRDRLLDGREPACVNACPENAIQIEIVNKLDWREDYSAADAPGMPTASQTISTTRVTLPKQFEDRQLERVDTGAIPLENAHPSLVLMTTAMQASFGLIAALALGRVLDPLSLTLLLLLVVGAINIATFHLGRPAYAWRALKMWRRSWLSREVLCFTLFLLAATATAVAAWLPALHITAAQSKAVYVSPQEWNVLQQACARLVTPLAFLTAFLGLLGTLASACIYLVKARPAWNMFHTPVDFVLSSGLIGVPLATCFAAPERALASFLQHHGLTVVTPPLQPWHALLALLASIWVANQLLRLYRMRTASDFELQATWAHLRGEKLRNLVVLSLACAIACAVFGLLHLMFCAFLMAASSVVISRYLFFVSVVPLSMGLTFLGGASQHHAPELAAA